MLRKAKVNEAKRVIELLILAYSKAIYKLIPRGEETFAFLEKIYKQKGNSISYENILLYEAENGFVAGMICSYDGADEKELDARLNKLLPKPLEPECLSIFYYIDAIAVDEKYRRQGIAKTLLDAACKEAMKANKNIDLLVDQDNLIAINSYKKAGFKLYSHLIFNNKPYFRMYKKLF